MDRNEMLYVISEYGFSGHNDSVEDDIAHRDALMGVIGKISQAWESRVLSDIENAVEQADRLNETIEAIIGGEFDEVDDDDIDEFEGLRKQTLGH